MFDLTAVQVLTLQRWLRTHDGECRFAKDAAATVNDGPVSTFPGRLEYIFRPVPLGMLITVKCVCGCRVSLTQSGDTNGY